MPMNFFLTLKALPICVLSLALLSGCSTASNPASASPSVTALVITGTTALTLNGATSQLTATATLSNRTTQNVTSSATWSSSSPAIASVSSGGLLTPLAPGTSSISATSGGQTAIVTVTVSAQTTPGGGQSACGQSNLGTVTMVLDGVPTTQSCVIVAEDPTLTTFSGTLYITAIVDTFSLSLTASASGSQGIAQGGTYSPYVLLTDVANGGRAWQTGGNLTGGASTLTVTSLTATGASGTFGFTATPSAVTGATGNRVATSGTFTVRFNLH